MSTFSDRLKTAIEKRGLSQAEAARKCGLSQQSINYIIKHKLNTSKLGMQISSGLNINPEWLIYGRGKFEESKVYEIPILHSPYMLIKFIDNQLDKNIVDYTVIDIYPGDIAFAYLTEPNKMVICSNNFKKTSSSHFLTLRGYNIEITNKEETNSFAIIEWRSRDVNY